MCGSDTLAYYLVAIKVINISYYLCINLPLCLTQYSFFYITLKLIVVSKQPPINISKLPNCLTISIELKKIIYSMNRTASLCDHHWF